METKILHVLIVQTSLATSLSIETSGSFPTFRRPSRSGSRETGNGFTVTLSSSLILHEARSVLPSSGTFFGNGRLTIRVIQEMLGYCYEVCIDN